MKNRTKRSSLGDELIPQKKSGLFEEKKKINLIKPAFPKKQSTTFPNQKTKIGNQIKPFRAAENPLTPFHEGIKTRDMVTKINKANDNRARKRPPGTQ